MDRKREISSESVEDHGGSEDGDGRWRFPLLGTGGGG